MERKEVDAPQFIDHDHTLLTSELIMRDPNNFIMDLIDTGVFPKAEGPTNLSTTRPNGHNDDGGGGTVGVNNGEGNVTGDGDGALTPELNFHNTIFQFVNKVEDDVRTNVNSHGHNQVEQPAFPALAIEPTVPIDDDLLYNAAHAINARKVLPHKKRISRKLKGNIEADVLLEQQQQQLKQNSVESIATSIYSCEICGYAVHTQLDFFAHLKAHYEPPSTIVQGLNVSSVVTGGGAEEQQLVQQQQQQQQQQHQQQKTPLDMCGLTTADHKLQQEQAKLDQVFHDVQLNFENFHNIHHTHVNDDVSSSVVGGVGVNMVIHGGGGGAGGAAGGGGEVEGNDKTPTVVTSNPIPSHDVVVDDVEFSDTEDMLEGIRNVVDKVSIEDTCDELVDLELASSGIRATWFNNNFSDIGFSGLLLPGEPPPVVVTNEEKAAADADADEPPTQSQPVIAAASTAASTSNEQITLDFLKEREEKNLDEVPPPQLSSSCCTPPPPPPPLPPASAGSAPPPPLTHSNGSSSIEQLQRSPLVLNEPLKLEEDEMLDASAPPSPYNESWENDDSHSIQEDQSDQLPEDDNDNDPSKSRRKYYCAKCVRNFNSYNALKYHQFTHNEQRTHKCGTCDRSFYTQSALNAHEKRHSDEKPFKCEHCDHRCRLWGDLKYHVISRHSELKAHMCEFCGKNFSRRYSLVLHRRIHTSERNYACEFCNKTFRASSYLLSHIKVHTGERPYKCSVCEKTFRVSGDLKRHSRIHDPVRKAQIAVTRRLKKNTKKQSKLKQIEDEDDIVETHHNNNKSDATACDESEQEILGL